MQDSGMSTHKTIRTHKRRTQSGMTLIELIIACSILLILAGAALPIARRNIKYQQEAELRRWLGEVKDGIDRYKEAAGKKLICGEVCRGGEPPHLATLGAGVNDWAG